MESNNAGIKWRGQLLTCLFKDHSFLASEFLLIAGVIFGFFLMSAWQTPLLERYADDIKMLTGVYFAFRQGIKKVNGNGNRN